MPDSLAHSIELRVPGTSARAVVLVGRGCTCSSAILEGPSGPREVLWAPEGFAEGAGRASVGGIPILCPFPGRLGRTTMEFGGRSFALAAGDGLGRPIHGLVHERPWRVVERAADRLVARFRLAEDAPDAVARWPADFTLTATWTLRAASLDLDLDLEAHVSMPAALGLHPYHPVPVVPGADPADCELALPATRWQPQERLLPVGPPRPVAAFAAAALGFPGRTKLAGLSLDDPFTGLSGDGGRGGRIVARVSDAASGAGVVAEWDPVFSACVLFTPPHGRAVCIEPSTVLPGQSTFSTAAGWRVLDEGGHLRGGYSVATC